MTHLKQNDPAPSFKAKDQNGVAHQLKDFKGKKLVLYFYPKDNTPGCTAQACSIRDGYEALSSKGISILGISTDDAESHKKFETKHQLNFPLLDDSEHKMVEAYGVWGPKKFMGKEYEGTHRTSFLIDEDGKIAFIIDKVKTKIHSEQILETWNLI
ncbi:MAG TPA: thioredoxin-dependent thiol peroxidase [Edaphocola sp.]|nr:thioredoxin-dependent thiol peroxidase [Edaphocola sp.]